MKTVLFPFVCFIPLLTLSSCSKPEPEELATHLEHKQFDTAMERNDLEAVREICSKNKNFAVSANRDGLPALHRLYFANSIYKADRTEIARILIDEFGAEVNQRTPTGCDRTSLHEAANAASIEMLRLILDRGADIEARDCEGSTPLHYAVRHGSVENIRLLLDYGADTKVKNKKGKLPVDETKTLALMSGKRKFIEPIKEMLNRQ